MQSFYIYAPFTTRSSANIFPERLEAVRAVLKDDRIRVHLMSLNGLYDTNLYPKDHRTSLGLQEPDKVLRNSRLLFKAEEVEKTMRTNNVNARCKGLGARNR